MILLDLAGLEFLNLQAGTLTLYLQMELCTSNLRAWLNQRNTALSSAMEGRDFGKQLQLLELWHPGVLYFVTGKDSGLG